MADRTGFRAIFLAALCVWILALLLLMNSSGYTALVLVFIGVGGRSWNSPLSWSCSGQRSGSRAWRSW